MPLCFFASDIHGEEERYRKLFARIKLDRPEAVFLGGDLLPNAYLMAFSNAPTHKDFVNYFIVENFNKIKKDCGGYYPRVFLILGNDDGRFLEAAFLDAAVRGAWEVAHMMRASFGKYSVYGYSYVPPTPFPLKDFEKYDVSRYVDPGCVSPEEGMRSFPVSEWELKSSTIEKDLKILAGSDDLTNAIFLFHSPPYKTDLDRAALDGIMIDYAPVDVHIGSVAIRRFIEERQPLLTLHGHVHESTRMTGKWRQTLGRTTMFAGATDSSELSLVQFDPDDPSSAVRMLI